MQTSHDNSKSKSKAEKNEKKVSFSAVEAIERFTDSTERQASLMDKMDTKLDRREDQYRPRIYQGRNRGYGYRQNNYRSRNRSYSRDQFHNNYRGRGNYDRGSNRNYSSNYRDSSRPKTETIIEMGIDTTIVQIIGETIVTKGMETEMRTIVALEKGIEILVVQEKVPNPEVETNLIGIRVEMKI